MTLLQLPALLLSRTLLYPALAITLAATITAAALYAAGKYVEPKQWK